MKEKTMLDKLYVAKVYQARTEEGYIEKGDIYSNKELSIKLSNMREVEEMGEIIVKKSILFPFQLRELITGIPIDTLYEQTNNGTNIPTILDSYWLSGIKNRYHTFIVIPYDKVHPTMEDVEEYFKNLEEENMDAEQMKNEILELINEGKKKMANRNQKIDNRINELLLKTKTK